MRAQYTFKILPKNVLEGLLFYRLAGKTHINLPAGCYAAAVAPGTYATAQAFDCRYILVYVA